MLSLSSPSLSLTLTLSLLMTWYSGQTTLFLFLYGKGGSGVLANCSLCGTEATLSFSAGPVCSSFSAKAYAILQALCWSRQHQQVCRFSFLFILSDSRSVLTTLSSPPSFLLSQTLWKIWQDCLLSPPVLSDHNGSPDSRFSRETTRLMSWPDGEHYLCPLQSLVVSLLFRIHSCLFSDWRRTVSSKFIDTQVPFDFHRGTCAPLSRSLCSLSSSLQSTQPSVRFLYL